MLVQSPVEGDSRVLREAATLASAGHDVHIVGRDIPENFAPPAGVTVESVGRERGLRPRGQRPARDLLTIRAARWLLLPEHRARVERAWSVAARAQAMAGEPADVVHAHDYNTLELAAQLARHWSAMLVYDAHEYWTGRPQVGRPTPVSRARVRRRERELGAEAAAVLTVGDGVARALRDAYGFAHITVVRNTFPPLPTPRRSSLPAPTALVYAGRLAADRELEVIAAASQRLDLPITLIGPADDAWLARFDPGKAAVLPPAPIDEIDEVLVAAGLALVTHSDRWPNHRLALPNKLFHAVRVGIPVVATDVGELADEVRAQGLGTLYRPGDVDALVNAVGAAVAAYPQLCDAVAAASVPLSWDVDARALLDVYAKLAT